MRLAPSALEILAAFAEHAALPNQRQIDELLGLGVRHWDIAGEPGSGEHVMRFACVRFDGRRFEFTRETNLASSPESEPATVVVALDDFGEPADLVAFRGGQIGSWLGVAVTLGQQHVLGARVDPALNVFRSGLDWLRGGRDGVVIVEGAKAARDLCDFGPLRAADIEHGLRLEDQLTQRPTIVVRAPADKAA